MKTQVAFGVRPRLVLTLLILAHLPLFAQTPSVEMKLRIMPVNGTTRVTDTNFQMAATSGFSAAQVNGGYYLYGPAAGYENAWSPAGDPAGVIALRFPGNPQNGWCPAAQVQSGTIIPTCDPSTAPNTRDLRCGDTAGLFWKSVTSSVPSWLYQNFSTGSASRLPPFAAVGAWPAQAQLPYPPPDSQQRCQLTPTGVPGWQPVVSAAAINAAIPNPPKLPTPGGCTRDATNPNSYATGAADAKVVYVNGNWYMAFSETINNPVTGQIGSPPNHYGWTSADLFVLGWATSTDGKTWTVRHQLFHTAREQVSCNPGLLVTQLTTDNGYFYMLVDEFGGKGLMLFRAPIDTANPDGFDNNAWQLETRSGGNITWTAVPTGSTIDTNNVNGSGLAAVDIAPTIAFVQQGSLARVFNSAAANSPSQIILVSTHDLSGTSTAVEVWSAPDFGSPFTFQSSVDLAFVKPGTGSNHNGWEFAFTYYPDQTQATPRIIGNELDFWLIGDFTGGAPDPSETLGLVAYRTTATLSGGGIYAPRTALRTSGGDYLSVTAGSVNATQTSVGLAARFVVLDPNVNVVQNGDSVNLQARNGNYISAANGGGGSAGAVPGDPGTNETFTIVKLNGSGPIVNGDSVAFRSVSGYYLVAENGGGGTVDFPVKTISANSTFTYVAQ